MKLVSAAALVLALASVAGASQVVLTPATVHSITPSKGFEYVGECNLQFGYNTGFDIVHDGLVRFNVASRIAPGSRVNSVELALTKGFVPFEGNVDLHRIVAAWSACPGTTTWYTPWAASGGDYLPAVATGFMSSGTSTGTVVFGSSPALVSIVQAWVDDPVTNHGWQLRDPIYWAEGYFDSPNVRLTVDFDPPCATPTTYCTAAPNSTGQGAQISSTGSTRISDHDFTLVVTGCPPHHPGVFFFGSGQQSAPFGDGFLCVSGQIYRLRPGVFANAQGIAVRPINFNAGSASNISPGSTWNFQFMYRDSVPGGAGFNASNALSATFCP